MKFSAKLLLSTMVVMAIALGFSGFYFVNYVFETSLEREVEQAMDENNILRFAFETAALNVPAKYDILQDNTVEQIAANLESGSKSNGRMLRLSDEEKQPLYASDGFEADTLLLEQTTVDTRTYRMIKNHDDYYIQTSSQVEVLDRVLYLETMRDVSQIFQERDLGFSVFRRVTVLMLAAGTLLMYMIAHFLTKPIKLLTKATRQMAAGAYDYRAKVISSDELGQLTKDFNHMAEALEDNVERLEEEIEAREEFVAAFAHELKTPLTSIIGYADMLRSRKLDEEKSFISANYIYTEGKRLEAMSLRLLDIIVTKQGETDLKQVPAELFMKDLKQMFREREDMEIVYVWDQGTVLCEENLIKTVLVNLLDNACKASEPGDRIEVTGKQEKEGYRFMVKDYGIGIPQEEQQKITKAFYMVDKSRARSKNGAGLGLALCTEILSLHNSRLEIESVPGEGSRISFLLPEIGEEEKNEENSN